MAKRKYIVFEIEKAKELLTDEQLSNLVDILETFKGNKYDRNFYVVPKNLKTIPAVSKDFLRNREEEFKGNSVCGKKELIDDLTKVVKVVESSAKKTERDVQMESIVDDITKKMKYWKENNPIVDFKFLLSLDVFTRGECSEMYHKAMANCGIEVRGKLNYRYNYQIGETRYGRTMIMILKRK